MMRMMRTTRRTAWTHLAMAMGRGPALGKALILGVMRRAAWGEALQTAMMTMMMLLMMSFTGETAVGRAAMAVKRTAAPCTAAAAWQVGREAMVGRAATTGAAAAAAATAIVMSRLAAPGTHVGGAAVGELLREGACWEEEGLRMRHPPYCRCTNKLGHRLPCADACTPVYAECH
eukprot:scaffold78776_cov16-Tisochrysis_lutea.AAC.3